MRVAGNANCCEFSICPVLTSSDRLCGARRGQTTSPILAYAIHYANKKGLYFLKLGAWSTIFFLLGYTSYVTTMIRSNADPSVDMYNVDNPVTLVGYLGREQYGDWPIVYGPDFVDQVETIDGSDQYVKTPIPERNVPTES